MEIKTTLICPLGSKCEEIKDGSIHRCSWFVTLQGCNPQTMEQIYEKGCAISWLPILLVENSKTNLSTTSAVESFRNEMSLSQSYISLT